MKVSSVERIVRLVRRKKGRRLLSGALVLLYHRVAELPTDPQLLTVTPQHFAEHLEILRRYATPTALQELVGIMGFGRLPRRSVVITFDDGYADNLLDAKPLLEKYAIPATVFSATGYIGSNQEFWWDQLERMLLHPGVLPELISLRIDGKAYNWELGDASQYDEKQYQQNLSWNVLRQEDPNPRQFLYRKLCGLLRPLSEKERREVLDELLFLTGAESSVRPTHRTLSAEELALLVEGGLIEVGSHSMTHSVLSRLSIDEQRLEILQSKARLEQILGFNITSFSYPYGSRSDFSNETVKVIREAGFSCACANIEGLIRQGTDVFLLPRVLVRDWDGERFATLIGEWFDG